MECTKVCARRETCARNSSIEIKQPSARRNLAAGPSNQVLVSSQCAQQAGYILSIESAAHMQQHPGIEKGKPLFLGFLITRSDTMRSRKHTGAFFCSVLYTYIHWHSPKHRRQKVPPSNRLRLMKSDKMYPLC